VVYGGAVRAGWLQGVYSNYTDIGTTNTNFSGDAVQREPNGMATRLDACYAIKPSKAVEFDEYYAQRIEKMYGVKMSYTDVHTANPQWEYNDFDARVPGAERWRRRLRLWATAAERPARLWPDAIGRNLPVDVRGPGVGSYGWVTRT